MRRLAAALLLAAWGCAGAGPGVAPPATAPPHPALVAGPDRLLLQGARRALPCQVLRLTGEELTIRVDRARLSLLKRAESPGAAWPDAVLAGEIRVVLRCRILAETPATATLVLPWAQVRRLERGAEGGSAPAGEEVPGGFSGRVLHRGRPLAGARVRAVRLTGGSLVPGVLEAPPRMDSAVEARTGADGWFRFDGLPPGAYKIWVQPAGGDQGWIRRLRLTPDVQVPPGGQVEMRPFNIKALVGSR